MPLSEKMNKGEGGWRYEWSSHPSLGRLGNWAFVRSLIHRELTFVHSPFKRPRRSGSLLSYQLAGQDGYAHLSESEIG